MARQTRTIFFSGQVQGVGFRYTVVQLAKDLSLDGTVRNLHDGRVEVVVHGASADMEKLIARLREHFGAFIRNVEQTQTYGNPTGEGPGIHIVS